MRRQENVLVGTVQVRITVLEPLTSEGKPGESHRSEEGVEASGCPIFLETETNGKDRRTEGRQVCCRVRV